MENKIILIEDDEEIRSMVKDYLSGEFQVLPFSEGKTAIHTVKNYDEYSLALIDLMLPDMSGMEIIKTIRQVSTIPIIIITAKDNDTDKSLGLNLGADDYVVKPFSLDELGARVAAHIRRERRRGETPKVRFDDKLSIDYTERRLYFDSEEISLAKKEFDIIELLSSHPGQIFSKERIYELVWGYDSEGESSVVAEHIRRIRTKLAARVTKPYVETVWGVGYKWVK